MTSPTSATPTSTAVPSGTIQGRADFSPADWFKAEVHPHDGQLKAYLRGQFPAVRDVDDVVQESYLRIWKARAATPIASAKAFLFTVARRIALDTIRKIRRSPIDSLSDLEGVGVMDEGRVDPAVAAARLEAKMQLMAQAIAALPGRQREIVILRKFDRLSQRETAERLQLAERTVENHLHRAIKACEAYVRARGIDDIYADEIR
jgi:RNA polymerase sigma factor (sigma-70 family)